MGRREENVAVFTDTVAIVSENEMLLQAIELTRKEQQIFHEHDVIPEPGYRLNKKGNVIVSKKRTLEAAGTYAYKGKKVCVLNFASATNPGGGVLKGSSAQEESLCRCSTLYFTLATDEMMKRFYKPHRRLGNSLYNDDLIYSPNVYVIKSDTSRPARLTEKDWYRLNVITCAAPNLRTRPSNPMNPNAGRYPANISETELEVLWKKRIQRIFAVAASEENDVLILGAFGCGAFQNPPQIVAKAFHEVLNDYRNCFETVEFAIFHTDYERENYNAFWKESCGYGNVL